MSCNNMVDAGYLAEVEGPIISVDDDEGFHYLLRKVHERSSMDKQLICLGSGKACLEYFDKVMSGESEMPAIVLVDANMPGMNGFETIAGLRTLQSVMQLPLIYVLSASNNRADMELAKEVGADSYIEKPFRLTELPIYH